MSSNRKRVVQIIVDIAVIVSIGVILLLVYLVNPAIRGFYCNDSDIFYPEKPDIVPDYALMLFGFLGTIVFILLIELINVSFNYNSENTTTSRVKQFIISIYHANTLFLLGMAITLLLTEIGKRWIGRLRPHFIAVCDPDLGSINCSATSNAILNYIDTGGSFCRGNEKKVKEARLSFPSGHSSFSCFTMIFLIIYLQARLNTLRFRYVKVLLQLTALIAAYVTSISRVQDNHHRGTDVLGGAALGVIVALFITFFSGKVIWVYKRPREQHEFDMKIEEKHNIEME